MMRIPLFPRAVRLVRRKTVCTTPHTQSPSSASVGPSSNDLAAAYAAAEARDCCLARVIKCCTPHVPHSKETRFSRWQASPSHESQRIHQLIVLSLRREGASADNVAVASLLRGAATVSVLAALHSAPPAELDSLIVLLGNASFATNMLPHQEVAAFQLWDDAAPKRSQQVLQALAVSALRFGLSRRCVNLSANLTGLATCASIAALVSTGQLAAALEMLNAFVMSRLNWRTFEAEHVALLHDICRYAGVFGDPGQVARLLNLCSRFYTPSLFVGRLVETTIAGLRERAQRALMSSALAAEVTAPISQVLQAALGFVGSDFNKDCLFSLIEGIAEHHRSPCTVALLVTTIRVMEGADSIGVRPSPPLQYRIHAFQSLLSSAPSHDVAGQFERSWGGGQLSENGLGGHWACLKCGKANSLRFSFCSCSAMQYGWVRCAGCKFAQDERNVKCLVCSQNLDAGNGSRKRAQLNWRCGSCSAVNNAFQAYQCGKCGAPSDFAQLLLANASTAGPKTCGCASALSRPTSQEPFCTNCGQREEWFANRSSHFTWHCGTCKQFHSWTDAVCPVFGNTERNAQTLCRHWDDAVVCPTCSAKHANPFVVECRQCNSDLRLIGLESQLSAAPASRHGVTLACTSCAHVNFNSRASDPCGGCSKKLTDAELTATRTTACPNCSASSERCLSMYCGQCGQLAMSLTRDDGKQMTATDASYFERCGWMNVVATLSDLSHLSSASSLPITVAVLEKIISVSNALDPCPPIIAGSLVQLAKTTALRTAGGHELLSRRVRAVCNQLMALSGIAHPTLSSAVRCRECEGSHPSSTCGFVTIPWVCTTCEASHINAGLSRYWCPDCLALRPEVSVLAPIDAWPCSTCNTLNLDIEIFCVSCGHDRDLAKTGDAELIPLVPSECESCGAVFLEALCPHCCDDDGGAPNDEVLWRDESPSPKRMERPQSVLRHHAPATLSRCDDVTSVKHARF